MIATVLAVATHLYGVIISTSDSQCRSGVSLYRSGRLHSSGDYFQNKSAIPVLIRHQLLEVCKHSGIVGEDVLFEAGLWNDDVGVFASNRKFDFHLHDVVDLRLDLQQSKDWSL